MIYTLLTLPLRYLPYRIIHRIGNALGPCLYYAYPNFRRRTLSNLALAFDLPNKELRRLAKASLGNLAITILEYPRIRREKNIHNLVTCKNPEKAADLIDQGVIFFVGHQANWETLFLEAAGRWPGLAIGRPIKNKKLYRWITEIREQYGGTIVDPKNAIKASLRALRKGTFVGIVGDQGMPDSSYAFPFFGKRAWTTPTPAILAHRTNSPIIVATCERLDGRYEITYSDPIWPDISKPLDEEIKRLMGTALAILEGSIAKRPEQWLWQHNRWKQETPGNVYYRFRKDPILIVVDDEKHLEHLPTFRKIYPRVFLTVLAPTHLVSKIDLEDAEIIPYRNPQDALLPDYRFKLVFDFTHSRKIKKHYKRYSAYDVLTIAKLQKLSKAYQPTDLSTTLTKVLCRAS